MVEAHLAGIFPRSEQLVQVTRAAARGKATQSEVDAILYKDIEALVALQEAAGLEYVVDGQINWQDLFRPFSELLTGIRPGSVTRWFDNNTFYRKPIITEKIRFRGNGTRQYFRDDLLPRDIAKKAILPGPFTFAVMSENDAYASRPAGQRSMRLAHLRGVWLKLVYVEVSCWPLFGEALQSLQFRRSIGSSTRLQSCRAL